MNAAGVRMGTALQLQLRSAILVYNGDVMGGAFATVHDVEHHGRKETPVLGPGRLLTTAFLAELAKGLGSDLSPEFLPANVLARTPHLMCWWTPAKQRVMYFRRESEMRSLNGKRFPIPALVWKLSGNEMHVRALASDVRPFPSTKLFVAPFWNTNDEGLVCQGSMKRPGEMSVASIDEWVDGYFNSEFTHSFGALRLTTHKQGFAGLWRELAGKREFDTSYLSSAKQTLQQFIQGEDAQDSAAAD